MRRLREQVQIAAPVEDIWTVVHQEIARVPRWSKNLVRTEVIGGGPVSAGSELLYVAKLPGGLTQELRLVVEEYDEYSRCAGTVHGTVMSGEWLWRYRPRTGTTLVTYETGIKLSGPLRFAASLMEEQVISNVRSDMQALKSYVEKRVTPR